MELPPVANWVSVRACRFDPCPLLKRRKPDEECPHVWTRSREIVRGSRKAWD